MPFIVYEVILLGTQLNVLKFHSFGQLPKDHQKNLLSKQSCLLGSLQKELTTLTISVSYVSERKFKEEYLQRFKVWAQMFEVGLSRTDLGWAVYDIMVQSSQRGRCVIHRRIIRESEGREWASKSWSPGLGGGEGDMGAPGFSVISVVQMS